MARPLRVEFSNAVYHVTARGNDRGKIYSDEKDYRKHLEIIEKNVERYGVRLYAYVLMGNHYHLLLETPDGGLGRFAHAVQSHYTNYYNRRHGRAGHLFQGRYKALLVEKESYLLEVSRYIHLNPARAGLVKRPEDWRWSSYRCYIGLEKRPKWLDSDEVLRCFGRQKTAAARRYREVVEAALKGPVEPEPPRAVAQLILGGDEFVEVVRKKLKDSPPRGAGDLPSARKLGAWSEREAREAVENIAAAFSVSEKQILCRAGKNNLPRAAALMLFRERSRWTLGEIAGYFGISYSAVTKSLDRTRKALEGDKKLERKLERISVQLKV